MSNSPIDISVVELAILDEPSVNDCLVMARRTEDGGSKLVAYVVPAGPFSLERLQSHLRMALPAYMLPCAYVPVSALPLNDEGQVDEKALSSLEIIDADLISRWEEQLRRFPEIGQVAVVVQEQTESYPPLHLSDLLPDREVAPILEVSGKIAAPVGAEAGEEQTSLKRPAISHGEPLRDTATIPATLPLALQRAASQTPTKGVVYLQSDGSEIAQSCQALLEEAERIMAGLKKLGLRPQDKVIFQLDLNQDFIPAFWGCVLGGFVPVPISIAPTYKESNSTITKLHNAWQMLDHPVVLTGKTLFPEIQSLSRLLNLENFRVETVDDLRTCDPDHDWHPSGPDDLALMLLTSGSTGMPKGVMLSHRNVLSRSAATAQMSNFGSEDLFLNWFPLDHVGGIVMVYIIGVFSCCRQVHVPTETILQEPLKWLDLIERYRATYTWAPNFAFGLINDRAEEINRRRWNLSSMRFILNGGEAIVAKTARRFLELLSPHGLPATAMHPAWGMSETSSGITSSNRFSFDSTTDDASFVEVGAPIPGISLRIVDHQDQVIEEDEIGRLQVKGLTITSGYYRNPDLNRESFSEDGWFNTGDLGFLHDGRLTITGRSKDVIIINGVNFYSHEIEAEVEEIEGVEVSYTAACAVRLAGKDTDRLAIFFNPSSSDWADQMELIKQIRGVMVRKVGVNPDYLIPVAKEEIPKTAIGKIQRPQLRERFEAGEFDAKLKQIDIHSRNANTIPDWFYRRSWSRREAVTPLPQPPEGRYLVFLDRLGLGKFLSEKLGHLDRQCVSVEAGPEFVKLDACRYRIDPSSPDHYRRLMECLAESNLPISHVLHLWNYTEYSGEVSSLKALEQSQYRGVYSLLFLVQALVRAQGPAHPVKLFAVSSNAQPISPHDKIASEKSTIGGLLKTIPLELPWLGCRHIDLEVGHVEVNAEHLLREMSIPKSQLEVAYRNKQRLISSLSKVDMLRQEKQDVPIKNSGIYLITGGLGGIGAQLAQFLIKQYQAKLIITGRTPLPERAEWVELLDRDTQLSKRIKNRLAIEAAGGEFIYRAVDVCDLAGLQKAVAEAESQWNQRLSGIFHLAGAGNLEHHWEVMDEHWVSVETKETFDWMFGPKVYGTWTLYQLIKDRPDALFVSFSSVNSLFGGATFSAYSAANSFLDCYSLDKRYHSHPQTYCFNWTMWDDLGMSQGNPTYARDASRSLGFSIISKEQGISSMIAGLYRDQAQLVVGLDGSSQHIRRYVSNDSYPLQTLGAYFTVKDTPGPASKLADLEVRDCFQHQSHCKFVQISEMPLTASGEIDLNNLGKTNLKSSQEAAGRGAPQTEIERQVANIWREVLGVPQVSMGDQFFELGGDSLLAMRLVNRLRDAFGVNMSLRNLFEMPTVAGLAAAISNGHGKSNDHTQSVTDGIKQLDGGDILTNIDQLSEEELDSMLGDLAESEDA